MNAELRAYIEAEILPRYQAFDKGHDERHIEIVTKDCMELAKEYGADEDMLYVICAYHDLGLVNGRATHHLTSAQILLEDERLHEWFTPEQITIMREAVEDHRASNDTPPRSLYGKIIADADREIDIDRLMYRTLMYGLGHFPDYSIQEQIDRTYDHVQLKYGEGGYMRFHLPASKANKMRLEMVHALLTDRAAFDDLARKTLREIAGEA